MKIKIDIDCSPEEARSFLGLPDVAPLQEAMLAAMRERMEQMMQSVDPETLMKMWMPAGTQGLDMMQQMFRTMAGTAGPGDKD